MIKSFKDKETEALFNDRRVLTFRAIENQARRGFLPAMNWRRSREIVQANIASGLTNNGEYASSGVTATLTTWKLSITTEPVEKRGERIMGTKNPITDELLDPIPPGEILLEDFMKPHGLSINRLAREIDVPPGRISEIIHGRRSITADTALRLGRFFGVSPEIWTGLQADYELRLAKRRVGQKIEERIKPLEAA
jgi:addiction module HigA family antidote